MVRESPSGAAEEQGEERACTLARMLRSLTFLLALALFGCRGNSIPVDGGVDGGVGGGTIGSCSTGFCISAIDTAVQGVLAAPVPQHAVAMRSDGTLGIAYFRNATGDSIDIMYVERSASGSLGTAVKVATVRERYGIAVAFHPSGTRRVI